ncbi:DUF2971 domain-containing protein [Spirosoma knui]
MVQLYNVGEKEMNETIWRYMDFTKFIHFLENSSIFFPKIDLFEDKYEGLHNALSENDSYDINDEGEFIRIDTIGDTRQSENNEIIKGILQSGIEEVKSSVGVSCWRMSQYESHAMWKIFLNSNDGIAIKTSLGGILEALQIDENRNLHLGKVQYIDYNNEKIPINNLLNPLFYKNIYFAHESEFRILAYDVKDSYIDHFNANNLVPLAGTGINVKLNYKNLIKEIVVGPYASSWFLNLLKKVSYEKYQLEVPINKSIIELR